MNCVSHLLSSNAKTFTLALPSAMRFAYMNALYLQAIRTGRPPRFEVGQVLWFCKERSFSRFLHQSFSELVAYLFPASFVKPSGLSGMSHTAASCSG